MSMKRALDAEQVYSSNNNNNNSGSAERRRLLLTQNRQLGARSPEDERRLSGLCAPSNGNPSLASSPPSSTPCVGFGSSEPKWEEKDVVNATIVRELNALSLKERENMFDEIHGVADAVTESEEFFNEKLLGLQKAINSIHVKPAYNLAKFIDPASVEDRELRIRMLRTDHYNPSKAARRLVNHFAFKQELFGVDLLVNDIRQEDLTESMREMLYAGSYQFSNRKDRSGRSIVYIRNHKDHKDWRTPIGMLYYIHMEAMKDFEDQRKGIVAVMEVPSSFEFSSDYLRTWKQSAKFMESMPYKMVAFHYMYHNQILLPALKYLFSNVHRMIQLRMRAHFGSFLECSYQLMSFGITKDMLPTDDDGNMDVNGWQRRMEALRQREGPRRNDVPNTRDVLLGRGCPYQYWVGNVFLAKIIELNRSAYESKIRGEKADIANAIVWFIKQRSGRFLRRNEDNGVALLWETVDDKDARNKISYGFRSPARPSLLEKCPTDTFVYPVTGDVIVVPIEDGSATEMGSTFDLDEE